MRTLTLLSLSAVVLIAAPAAAAVTTTNTAATTVNQLAQPAVSPSDAKPQAVQEKKICRQLPSSYSRMTTRTCLTAKEWKQVEDQDR